MDDRETELWWNGLVKTGERRLRDDELAVLRADLVGRLRGVARRRLGLGASFVIALGVTTYLFTWGAPEHAPGGAIALFAALVPLYTLFSAGASLTLIVASECTALRVVLLASAITWPVAYLLETAPLRGAMLTGAGAVIFFFGGVAGIAVFRADHDLARQRARVLRDLEVGIALTFSTPAHPALHAGDEPFEPYDLEMLPESGTIIAMNGVANVTPLVMGVTYVEADRRSLTTIAPDEQPLLHDDPTQVWSERPIREDERADAARWARGAWKRALGQGLVATFIAASVLRFVANLWDATKRPTLAPTGWAIALAIGAAFVTRHVVARRRVLRDLARGVVHVVRDHEDHALIVEGLPESGLLLTASGARPPWRDA